jgi:hypothetical protein
MRNTMMHVKTSIRFLAFAALAALWIFPATLFADTPTPEQWIVTSAKTTGRNGEDYRTSLRIVNPNAVAVSAYVWLFLASGDGSSDNLNGTRVTVSVAANSTLAIDDVLGSKFGVTGAAGLLVQSIGFLAQPTGVSQAALWALSQTLVTNAKSSTGVSGTNGFAIPAQSTDQLVAVDETAYVPYVSSSTSGTSGYRTNLFLLSANATIPTVATVTLLKGDGTVLGTRDITLARYAQTQINDIASSFGYAANDTNLTATVKVKSGGPVATGASVIDNAIGSISYSPPVKTPVANNGAYGLILNDGYGFSGRAEVFAGSFDYVSAGVVIPSCPVTVPPSPTLFFIQGIGTPGDAGQNATFTKNTDGSTSFAGTMKDSSNGTAATFSGTILTEYDGTIFGNLTYTRGAAPGGNPCPAATVTLPFSGSKGLVLP